MPDLASVCVMISASLRLPTGFLTAEWVEAYNAAKALAVNTLAACGREDLAGSVAEAHDYFEGIVELCHAAELREVSV